MAEDLAKQEDWVRLSNWEQQCLDEVEKTPDMEVGLQHEKDAAVQKLWLLFQNAATGIAQLYRDRQTGISLWVPFQNTASSVTSLYKESVDSQKRFHDMGYQCGYQKRSRDLLSWAKKRKRHIQREELIAFLTGRNPPPPSTSTHRHHPWGPRPRLVLEQGNSRHHRHHHHPAIMQGAMMPEQMLDSADDHHQPDFEIFREAIAFPSNHRQHTTGSPTSSLSRMSNSRTRVQSSAELSAFISEEFTRYGECRKRSPSNDVIMDSPTHKRSRLNSHIL